MTRFVYIDEAGISNPQQEPILVVAAVIVHADKQLNELEERISRIADKYIPSEHRDGFVFHAKDLFNGGGNVFRRNSTDLPLNRRLEIAASLAAIPQKMNLPLAFGIVQRAIWPLTFDASSMSPKDKVIGQHVTAHMTCTMDVEMWMRDKCPNEIVMQIVEDNQQSRSMIKQIQNDHRHPSILDGLDASARRYFPLKKIKSSPLFEGKQDSLTLQMADFCAYVMKKRAMNDTRYAALFSQIHPMFVHHSVKHIK